MQFRGVFYAGSTVILTVDSHRDNDPDLVPQPKWLHAFRIRRNGNTVRVWMREELAGHLAPLVQLDDNVVSIGTLSKLGGKLNPTGIETVDKIEMFEVTPHGRCLNGISVAATFLRHTQVPLKQYLFEGLYFTHPTGTPIAIPDADLRRGRRVLLQA